MLAILRRFPEWRSMHITISQGELGTRLPSFPRSPQQTLPRVLKPHLCERRAEVTADKHICLSSFPSMKKHCD